MSLWKCQAKCMNVKTKQGITTSLPMEPMVVSGRRGTDTPQESCFVLSLHLSREGAGNWKAFFIFLPLSPAADATSLKPVILTT